MKSLIKLSLLSLTTLTFIACGGGSSGGGNSTPAPNTGDGGNGGGGTPDPTEIRISEATGDEGENITFTVTANPPITKPISFSYRIDFENQTASADDLSSDISGRSTIAASSDSTTISILIKDDDINEPAETFRIVLSNLAPAGAIFTKNTALGTISASDPTEIRISGAAGNEGGMINFKVIANPTIAKPINFSYSVNFDNSLSSSSATTSDINLNSLTGTSTIATNDSSVTISIATVNDNLRENAETFLVMLRDLSPTSDVTFGDHIGEGTILANDDATGIVTISLVTDATASEENTGRINFQVKSEFTAISPFTFNYAVDFDNSSADTDDFTATTGTATIPAGKDSTTISIYITGDTIAEENETFRLLITNPTSPNATIDSANNSAIGTILNDDLGEISGATATPSARQVTLNWTNPNSNLFAGVTIAQTTSTDAPLNCASAPNVTIIDAQQTTSRNIIGLTDGTTYSFLICAKSNDGSLSSGVGVANVTPDGNDDGDGILNSMDVDDDNDGLIEITNATELNNMRHNLDGDGYIITSGGSANTSGCPTTTGCNGYELISDITLSGAWTPIGTFTATFDGNNRTISGLRITGNNDVGLFSILNNATISNLKLTNIRITGIGNIGALVGDATGTTALSNIELIGDESQSSSDAEIKGTGGNVGGLVGSFRGTITDASSSLTVSGGTGIYIGGLVGFLQNSGSIKNSNSGGFVSASNGANIVGGLVGHSDRRTTIRNSWASGNVSSTGNNNEGYGGLVGRTIGGTISNSWASGNVSSNGNSSNLYYGGLIGYLNGSARNSWASGEVTSFGRVGGLIGHADVFLIGRNYRLDSDRGQNASLNNSIELDDTTDLANLSGAASTDTSNASKETHSEWHAGFDIDNPRSTIVADFDLETMFCDTNRNGRIDGTPDGQGERVPTNSVWVMPSEPTTDFPTGMSDNVPAPTSDTAGNPQNYYAILALRCIGNTKGKTPTEINAIRKANIDRQRRLFPQ